MAIQQKISPNLWFDHKAEEAVKFYTGIFKNSSTGKITRYGKEGFETHKMAEGKVLTIEFFIEGQRFIALNAGPEFKFTEAISFIIDCANQEEIDFYWDKLSDGGNENDQVCGWLKDKFGVSWQIVPPVLGEMLTDKDKAKAGRVMQAMMGMKKLIIADLKKAYNG